VLPAPWSLGSSEDSGCTGLHLHGRRSAAAALLRRTGDAALMTSRSAPGHGERAGSRSLMIAVVIIAGAAVDH
jgi:hypothetical protein